MAIGLLEIGGALVGLGVVAYVATRQTPQGTSVAFSQPDSASVAAITSSNASIYSAQQTATTAKANIGAQLALGLAQVDSQNRANALVANTQDLSTAANLQDSINAQATQFKIASAADATTVATTKVAAASSEKIAGTVSTANVAIAKAQSTASVNIAQVQGQAQTAVAASNANAEAQVAQQQTAAKENSNLWGGIASLATAFL